MIDNNHQSSSNSSSDERRDRYDADLGESDSDSQHERPSFVSTSGNLPLLVAADEPPTSDGFMRMASAEIDAYTQHNGSFTGDADAWHFDDDPVSPGADRRQQFNNDRRHRFQKQSSSVENKLWLVLLRQRRFFSFRSRSSSGGSGGAGGSHSYQSDRSDSDIVVR
jgi:hypothetical protein